MDPQPAALAKRARAWRNLAERHRAGAHHDVLCRSDATCAAYDRVLRSQLDLVERALRLPSETRDRLADALEAPGRAPLRRLVVEAEADARPAVSQVEAM